MDRLSMENMQTANCGDRTVETILAEQGIGPCSRSQTIVVCGGMRRSQTLNRAFAQIRTTTDLRVVGCLFVLTQNALF